MNKKEILLNLLNEEVIPETTITNKNQRWQDDIIIETITKNSKVLDLGCGEGVLLEKLSAEKNIQGQGVELSYKRAIKCIEKQVSVIQTDLDDGLPGFPNKSFDFVICEQTLPTVNKPLSLIREIVRIGKIGIISFPNFGHRNIRLDLALSGKMPESKAFPHSWIDTPNIHPMTLNDFYDLAKNENIEITKGYYHHNGAIKELSKEDNLNAEIVLLIIKSI